MSKSVSKSSDECVRKTAELAILQKCSAVALGYYDDEYISKFVRSENQMPGISYLYTLRVLAGRLIIDKFFECFGDGKVQFVNLGAGFDTISFYVLKKHPNAVCFETDFEAQMRLKSQIMSENHCFKDLIPDMVVEDGVVTSERFKMVPFDLTNTHEFQKLVDAGLSKELPTIFMAEAVFMYIDPVYSDPFLKLLSEFCNKPSCYLCFNLVRPYDKFGKMIYEKFQLIGTGLLGFKKYGTKEEQEQRYKNLGWEHSVCVYLNKIWSLIDQSQRDQIKNAQSFNEMEEVTAFLVHSMIGLAAKNVESSPEFVKCLENGPKKDMGGLDRQYEIEHPDPPSEDFNQEYYERFFYELSKYCIPEGTPNEKILN